MKSQKVFCRVAFLMLSMALVVAGCGPEKAQEADEHAGHEHATAPAASSRDASSSPATALLSGERCAGHNAPKEWCFICDPGLREKGRLWCNEHQRYEDRCWICHPESQDKARLYCEEHGLYEDECFICHPELKTSPAPAAPSQAQAGGLMCREHGVPEAECGVCHPELAALLKAGQGIKVRLPAAGSATMEGVNLGTAQEGGLGEGVECLAEFAFDQNRLAQITTPVGGIIKTVEADLGAAVKEQQVVAKIWSASIAETVAKAVLTHQTLERERRLRAEKVTSERDFQQAEAEHRAACQQARTLGFTEEQIDAFGATPDEPVMLEVRAPFGGEIVERWAVQGALIDTGKPLFTVADRSVMWAMLSVPETALSKVHQGQSVELRLEAFPGQTVTGKLTWISAKVDERTRMATARAEVPNPQGTLRANMFARARIITRPAEGALVVPASAVHRLDGKPLVFVRLADDLYEARAVELGAGSGGRLEIVEGLTAREQVVLSQGFPIKSQLLISRLGAGCADE